MYKVSITITEIIELSEKLLAAADQGDLELEDDSCGVLFGVVRDCAYKLLAAAAKEREYHIQKGTWDC
jgi:hypothetical protein